MFPIDNLPFFCPDIIRSSLIIILHGLGRNTDILHCIFYIQIDTNL